ncbi:SRPBCC family protein [Streptomyces nanshensis]|uniref:Polyketide cyclase n=1 Tax=Streptomyces nanshensis TaxID=518642 RepID=A0A1E7L7F0_9ACTN|nr:SRPBCC family protein [Streptomyces nanshensis]OEV12137.1 polyketide cyclase [Streptomyces nanshensis]
MAQVEASTQREIAAGPGEVRAALADYRETRPKLLPEHYSEYEVREGGEGVGTVVHWKIQATSKRVRDCLVDVTEPAGPGEGDLVESDRNSTMVTTWKIAPGAADGSSHVTVTTTWQGASGIGGFFERAFAPKGLARIYDEMLAKLAAETEK